jgi:DNA-directed RNA polymerase specialized sigma24 family protein
MFTAGDRWLAEDVVQTALARVYVALPRIRTNVDGYARRAVVNAFLDHHAGRGHVVSQHRRPSRGRGHRTAVRRRGGSGWRAGGVPHPRDRSSGPAVTRWFPVSGARHPTHVPIDCSTMEEATNEVRSILNPVVPDDLRLDSPWPQTEADLGRGRTQLRRRRRRLTAGSGAVAAGVAALAITVPRIAPAPGGPAPSGVSQARGRQLPASLVAFTGRQAPGVHVVDHPGRVAGRRGHPRPSHPAQERCRAGRDLVGQDSDRGRLRRRPW